MLACACDNKVEHFYCTLIREKKDGRYDILDSDCTDSFPKKIMAKKKRKAAKKRKTAKKGKKRKGARRRR